MYTARGIQLVAVVCNRSLTYPRFVVACGAAKGRPGHEFPPKTLPVPCGYFPLDTQNHPAVLITAYNIYISFVSRRDRRTHPTACGRRVHCVSHGDTFFTFRVVQGVSCSSLRKCAIMLYAGSQQYSRTCPPEAACAYWKGHGWT